MFHVRTGEDWKKGRSAANKQIKPSNVQTYTFGLSDVATRFAVYLKSVRDERDRIGDISMPLRRLLMDSMKNSMILHCFLTSRTYSLAKLLFCWYTM